MVLKRLTHDEIKFYKKYSQEGFNQTTNAINKNLNSEISSIPRHLTDLVKDTTNSQSFSNVDDIFVTQRTVQINTNLIANSNTLSNDGNSDSENIGCLPVCDKISSTVSISNSSDFNLEFGSDPTIFNLLSNSDEDEHKSINFIGDEFLLKSSVVCIKTTSFSKFAERL